MGRSPVREGIFNRETTSLDVKTAQGSPMGPMPLQPRAHWVSVDMTQERQAVLDIGGMPRCGQGCKSDHVSAQIEGGVSMAWLRINGRGPGEEGAIRPPVQ